MKIAILSRYEKAYSTQRLVQAAHERGHSVEVIDTLRCHVHISTDHPAIYYKGRRLEGFDAVIPRIGASATFYGTAVLRQCELLGMFLVNKPSAISRARNKLLSLQVMARKGIRLPITGFAHSADDTDDLIQGVGKPPLVIKLLEGTQGKGVVLAETKKAAESVIDAFAGLQANILVQEFIKEAACSDIRCFVVGGRVVASMRRQAKPGEFRSNIHQGGTGHRVKITPEERAVAVRAAQVMGLNVAGVDLVRSKHGAVVLEVNSSPGLRGIEGTTQIDVATKIIQFIEKSVG